MTRAAFLGGVLTLVCVQTADAQIAKPPVKWRPAHSGNYSHSTSRKTGVVIHKMEGTNAEVWFANPAASSSTQYSVHFDGAIWQSVPDANVAWHCGNTVFNTAFLSIEHAGWSARNDVTEAEYRASARLVAWMCVHYRIPIDRKHIIGHNEVPDPNSPGKFGGINNHTDPGPHWNWTHYLNLVRTYANGKAPTGGAPVPGGAGGSTSSGALRNGSRGPAVADLQRLLAAKGFNPGPIDGIFGPRTDGAVRAFQRARGLVVDGIAGPQTLNALRASSGGGGAPAPAANRPTLREGSRGGAVSELQRLLATKGFNPGPIDGIFGPRTEAAVKAYQRSRKLFVDGVVGPKTWGSLL